MPVMHLFGSGSITLFLKYERLVKHTDSDEYDCSRIDNAHFKTQNDSLKCGNQLRSTQISCEFLLRMN